MAFNVVVDEEKCAGCEECVDVCPVEVFEMKDDTPFDPLAIDLIL
jgi:Fe-S-cluster-containing hydrogenase component 2